jgi:hypothetical protein
MRIALILAGCVSMALLMGAGSSSTAKKDPSMIEKVETGTKNFFTGIGDTLTGKKKPATAPKPSSTASAVGWKSTPQTKQPAKQPEKQSWLTSMFKGKEPEKAKTPSEWIAGQRPGY